MEDALLCLPTAIHKNYSMHAEAKETEAPLFQVTVSSEFHMYRVRFFTGAEGATHQEPSSC